MCLPLGRTMLAAHCVTRVACTTTLPLGGLQAHRHGATRECHIVEFLVHLLCSRTTSTNSTTCPVNADTVCPLDISYNEAVVKYPAGVDRSSTAVKDALCVTAGLSSKMADRGGTGWVNYQCKRPQSSSSSAFGPPTSS